MEKQRKKDRTMRIETSSRWPSTSLGLNGLVHVWGPAGAGKSLFAVAMAAQASANTQVEWISTDGKMSFIPHLKRNVKERGGSTGNILVTMTRSHNEAQRAILNLVPLLERSTALIVVDPVTRVADMARSNPTLWGQELIEEALPTLAALAANGSRVLVTSECRLLQESENAPVHQQAIRRWSDKEILIRREMAGRYSSITGIDPKSGVQTQIGRLRLLDTGLIEVNCICQSSDIGRNP